MGKKYVITDKEAMYFISFATIGWVDVFSRKEYRDIPPPLQVFPNAGLSV